MRVLMIAPPGAGKGTQGALIAVHFGIPHISTGEVLRDHVARRTSLGLAVQAYLDRGELVPDQVVLDMLREAMVAAKAAGGGFVLDGIPRNMHQARGAYLIGRELEMTIPPSPHPLSLLAPAQHRSTHETSLPSPCSLPEYIPHLLYRTRILVSVMRSSPLLLPLACPFLLASPLTSPASGTHSARPTPPSAHPAEPSGRPPGLASAAWRLPGIRHCGTCPAPPGNRRGYSARLDGRFASTWTARPGPARTGTIDAGPRATARSGGTERIEPAANRVRGDSLPITLRYEIPVRPRAPDPICAQVPAGWRAVLPPPNGRSARRRWRIRPR